jgi:tetratricopeptide (TPR) repeat protein
MTSLALLCSLIGCTASLFAQSAPTGRVLHGKVVKTLRENVSEPIANANITLEQTGKSITSNSAGLFFLPLPQSFLEGEEIVINIAVPGYAIFQPVGGHARIPRQLQKDVVTFELLPLGSPRFFSHEHLVALLKGVAEKSAKDVRSADNQQKDIPDLSRYLEDWAHLYGFGLDQVKAEVDRWANEVEKKKENNYELGLAAFAKKNFSEAGARFLDSARQNEHKLQEVHQRERQLMADTIRDYQLTGDSYSNSYDFGKSAEMYEKALSLVDRRTDPQLWATVSGSCGIARWNLGIRTSAEDAVANLSKAKSYYEGVLEVYTREQLPQAWAATQNNLGNALRDLAGRSEGAAGVQALNEAVSGYRRALEVYTREQLPQDWAMTENNLGIALRDLAGRSEGAAGVQALNEAVSAYRRALEVYNENENPFYWLVVTRNLAEAYERQRDWTKARETYQQLLRHDPGNESYRSKVNELAQKRR